MESKKRLSSKQAYAILQSGRPLENSIVKEELDIHTVCMKYYDEMHQKTEIIGCDFDSFQSMVIMYFEPVILKDCRFKIASFWANYFHEGLLIERCEFLSDISFSAGGHNHKLVKIVNTKFHGFVDFCDCWFQGPVEIKGCEFAKGSNLLGLKNSPIQVHFDVHPIIENNIGKIDMDYDPLEDK